MQTFWTAGNGPLFNQDGALHGYASSISIPQSIMRNILCIFLLVLNLNKYISNQIQPNVKSHSAQTEVMLCQQMTPQVPVADNIEPFSLSHVSIGCGLPSVMMQVKKNAAGPENGSPSSSRMWHFSLLAYCPRANTIHVAKPGRRTAGTVAHNDPPSCPDYISNFTFCTYYFKLQ